jgi:hypothetical protein
MNEMKEKENKLKRKRITQIFADSKILIFIIFFIPVLVFGQAQLRSTYPIQATAVLYPPYSLYLSDYSNPSLEKIALVLLNRDLMESDVEVRLHISISAGNGLTLQTRDYNTLPTFHLPPGVPVRLGNSDLSAYFQLQNLTANGAFDGKMPEGMLEVCFTVYEMRTGALVSQTSCARAWITLNRPPLLSQPFNKSIYPFREPQQFVFQWTPRHQALSNVEYEFTLKEIHGNGAAIENIFAYSPTIYSTTVSTTSMAYNTAINPPLLENTTYAWQVRAVVRNGFEELNLFENNGYSEIFSFSLQPACYAPTGLSATQEGTYEKITWTPSDRTTTQVVAYRGKQNGGDWHLIKGNLDYANLFDLSYGTEYEYKVGTVCVDGTIVYSSVYTFILEDSRKNIMENCGIQTEISVDRSSLLPQLSAGDVFRAGDFPVTVTKVDGGGNGTFSGAGWTQLPVFADSKVAVKFTGVQINSDHQVVGGYVETTYDASDSQLSNLDFIDQGGTNTGQTNTGDIWTDLKTGVVIPPGGSLTYDPETGSLIVSDANGNPVTDENGKPISIEIPSDIKDKINNGEPTTFTAQDENGDVYTATVDKEGNVTTEQTGSTGKGGSDSGQFNPNAIDSKDAIVVFSQGANAQYAFDTWINEYDKILLIRDKYEHLGNYDVPAKLIPPGRTDKVTFTVNIINKNKINPDSIVFRSGTGTEYVAKGGEISITGGKENDAQDIYALYPDGKGKLQTLGKLKVLSYKELNVSVKLVPVNGSTIDEKSVTSYLNQVYGQLGIGFTVSKDENFSYPDDNLQSDGSSFFSLYTLEMKALNAAYKSQRGVDKQTVYLFVLKTGNVKGYNLAGDMPRGSQFGYIFTEGQNQENINHTIAHEVGHGKFKLRHTFDSDYGGILKQGSTDNLMDYGTGTHLAKWQWDMLFDPALLVSPFESDKSGMQQNVQENVLLQIVEILKKTGENGCAFVRKNQSISNITQEAQASVETSTLDYLIGKYENEKISFNIALGSFSQTDVHSFTVLWEESKTQNVILYIANGNVQYCFAKEDYSEFTSLKEAKDNPVFLAKFKTDLLNCKSGNSQDDAFVMNTLQQLQPSARGNQSIELYYNSNSYSLTNGKLQLSELSDENINAGNWDDANVDSRIRYTINDNGIIQVKAFGFRKNMPTFKTANLQDISKDIIDKTNKFLSDNQVKEFDKIAPIFKNDNEAFADGEKIVTGAGNSTYFKIIHEGIGVVGTLLKTGTIEENVYLSSTGNNSTIHAPGILTGSFEVVAQKVTDITSLGCLVYDVSFDSQVRSELYKQFKGVKDQIVEDPGSFFPVIGEILLTITTNNTSDDWKTISDENADAGKRSHLVTRGTGNAVITVMSGAALAKCLPEIGDKLTDWVKVIKGARNEIRKVLTTDAGVDYLRKYFDKFVNEGNFTEWLQKAKDYKLGKLNFEVHHVIPVNVLENNKEPQRILEKFNFDFNGMDNAIPLQKKNVNIDVKTGHANHPQYDDAIKKQIEEIMQNPRIDDAGKFEKVKELINNAKSKLENDVLLGNKDVNSIITF